MEFDGAEVKILFDDGHIEAMPIEAYLRGVIPSEMPTDWPLEALKAQAVAARTYTARRLVAPAFPKEGAHVHASHRFSQEYNPKRIHSRTDDAILATKSLILKHDGKIIDAVFSANCGGHTSDSENVWKHVHAYLRGVPCPNQGKKHGHGVGMCQHGANTFAERGWLYDQILHYYYTNVVICPL